MNDNRINSDKYRDNKPKNEHIRQEGSKGGQSYFTTWYEFESDTKDEDKNKRF